MDVASSAVGGLKRVIIEQQEQAKTKNQTVLLMLGGTKCTACKAVDSALGDPLLQEALDKVRLLRVDLREFSDELSALGMRPKVMPVFALLGDDARATDAIHGGEWDADIAQNIAPVLGAFVRGRYEKRRDATWSISGVPAKSVVSDPEADYHSLDDILMDGNKATGKTGLLRLWRGNTEAKRFVGYVCGGQAGSWVRLSFDEEQQSLVRAIPPSSGNCPRVRFRVTGRDRFSKTVVEGEVLDILDVVAEAAQAAPDGVDYVSMDDINMAGKAAREKIGLMEFWRGNVDESSFTAYPCGKQGGIQFIKMSYTEEQREIVRQLPTSSREGCKRLRFKLRSQAQFGNTWQADLLESN